MLDPEAAMVRGAGWTLAGLGLLAVTCAGSPAAPRGRCPAPGPEASCLDCHMAEPALTHPVGVRPSMEVPAHLPLVGGRLACVTCHDMEGQRGAVAGRGAVRPAADCAACHDARRGRVGDLHALATGRAHLAWRDAAPRRSAAAAGHRLDAESRRCLGCHDGAVARGAGERLGRRSGAALAEPFTSRHPIGVEQGPRGPGDNLVHAALLDRRIRLFDGRVGCGSCHSPYSAAADLLVMSNERSALCLSCHRF